MGAMSAGAVVGMNLPHAQHQQHQQHQHSSPMQQPQQHHHQQQMAAAMPYVDKTPVLYFANLPFDASESDLAQAISLFGFAVRLVMVPKRNEAFVQMQTIEQVRTWTMGFFFPCSDLLQKETSSRNVFVPCSNRKTF
jgi:hypothetical protein